MTLLAVRHGQASFGAANYDELSALGRAQTRRLGDWLARHERVAHCVIGDMQRHRQSLDEIAAAFAALHRPLPTPTVDAALNEFDHRAVVSAFIARDPDHPAVRAASAGESGRDSRAMFNLLRAALQIWASGELDQRTEPWADFRERTRAAGRRLLTAAQNGPVLLVSSGGVIAQLAAEALQVPDARAVELNLSLRNSALSEFVPLGDGMRLSSWNALPHLAEEKAMWTYI